LARFPTREELVTCATGFIVKSPSAIEDEYNDGAELKSKASTGYTPEMSTTDLLPLDAFSRRERGERANRLSSLDIATFFHRLSVLSRDSEHKAVDAVYNFIDDLLQKNDFESCDDVLAMAQPSNLLLSVVISFLIVTRRAKPKLNARAQFLDRSQQFYANDGLGATLGKYA